MPARIEHEDERFSTIRNPPERKTRWSADDASRRVSHQAETPVSSEEKATAPAGRGVQGHAR
ncbi:DUF6192 family protein [Streptomyces sp. NPDC002812]|uniref:DUF6192 family protein n=1 Tax=Streptomyces sp. NPDC002812 TaxID=3154434 RepID=UPI003333C9A5